MQSTNDSLAKLTAEIEQNQLKRYTNLMRIMSEAKVEINTQSLTKIFEAAQGYAASQEEKADEKDLAAEKSLQEEEENSEAATATDDEKKEVAENDTEISESQIGNNVNLFGR